MSLSLPFISLLLTGACFVAASNSFRPAVDASWDCCACDGSCDELVDDVSLLQKELQVFSTIAKDQAQPQQESKEDNDEQHQPSLPIAEDAVGKTQAKATAGHAESQRMKQTIPQVADIQDAWDDSQVAAVFFQTESVTHSLHKKEASSIWSNVVGHMKNNSNVLPAASMAACSMLWLVWLMKGRCKYRVAPSDAGDKGLLAEAVAKDSPATLMNVDEETSPSQWDARMFSTPVQEPFGLSVDTAEGIELKAAC